MPGLDKEIDPERLRIPEPEARIDSSYPPGHPDHYVHDPEGALALAAFYGEEPQGAQVVDEREEK